MKKILLIFSISLITGSWAFAQENQEPAETIDCSNGQCTTSFTPDLLLEKPFFTSIEVGTNDANIDVSTPEGQTPRSLRLSVNNGENSRDLTIDLSSQKEGENAGDIYVIGDRFRNLTVRLNGYNGERGKDASEICAENVLAGEYGSDVRDFFQGRRDADPGVPTNRCDRVDLNYLQTFSFTCDDPSYQPVAGTNPVVDVKRLRTKSRCTGVLVRDLCLRRKRIGVCRWRSWVRLGCGKHGCSYGWGGSWHSRSRNWIEDQYNYERRRRSSDNFCAVYYGWPGGSWRLWDIYWYYTSPGVNGVTFTPLPGSDWQIYQTTAYGACARFWTTVRTLYSTEVTFDENNTACDDVGIPEDPNRLIEWAYTGPAQEPEFGTEIVQCAVGACPVQASVSELDRQLDVITPESGTSGSQQGKGLIFIYDADNLTEQSVIGQAGAAGLNDIQSNQNVKYCVKISDADSNGINSDFARIPNVSFRKYRWSALRSQAGGNPGNPPPETGKKVEIYKKLDSSVRYLLQKELL